MVWALKLFMKGRAPYDLWLLRVAHNVVLCFGSLVMAVGLISELAAVYQEGGVESLFCDRQRLQAKSHALYYWFTVFYFSKFYEFLDTVILVLRQKPTTFLHVWHHFSTALLVLICTSSYYAPQWCSIIPNAIVHVFMYYYYLLQTLNQDVWWKSYLTSMQIAQFVFDLVFLVPWFFYNSEGQCSGSYFAAGVSYFVLGSFLVLFINFYIQNYTSRRRAPRGKSQETDGAKPKAS